MAPKHSLLVHAEEEVRAGRLWRAKEILGGNLATFGYRVDLYEGYGKVLLAMGDLLEAGRFLFLSGVRSAEYEEAIGIYLERYGEGGLRNLVGTFPHAARWKDLEDYPESVRATLVAFGAQDTLGPSLTKQLPQQPPLDAIDVGCLGLVLAIVGFLVAALTIGIPELLDRIPLLAALLIVAVLLIFAGVARTVKRKD